MTKRIPVFVYGTLLEGFENHRLYVQPYPHRRQTASIKGELYHLPVGYPGLLQEGSGWVKGELIWFAEEAYAAALAGLDELETFYRPGDPRNEYERILTEAFVGEKGEVIQAYTYLFVDNTHAKEAGIYLPDGDWRLFMQNRRG